MMKRSRRVVMTQPMKPATIAKSRPNGSTESQSAPVSCSESAMVAVVGAQKRHVMNPRLSAVASTRVLPAKRLERATSQVSGTEAMLTSTPRNAVITLTRP